MRLIRLSLFVMLLIGIPGLLRAQACCSAGTPLSGSLELPATPSNQWQNMITYQYNSLQDLVAVSNELSDDTRQRAVHSLLIESSYGVSGSVSLSALFTLVQQERRIQSQFAGTNFLRTRGVGDAVLLLKYTLIPGTIFSQRTVSLGIGPKIPLGDFNRKSNGIYLPYDMQPGTGAWDGMLWGHFYQGFRPFPIHLLATTVYRVTGKSNRGYEFGNELVVNAGIVYQNQQLLDGSILLRYRQVGQDKFDNNSIANTGGHWLYLNPGINVNLTPGFAIRISGQIPIYRRLNGDQLTTTYRMSVSSFINLTSTKEGS